jgi:hypothetical protein
MVVVLPALGYYKGHKEEPQNYQQTKCKLDRAKEDSVHTTKV